MRIWQKTLLNLFVPFYNIKNTITAHRKIDWISPVDSTLVYLPITHSNHPTHPATPASPPRLASSLHTPPFLDSHGIHLPLGIGNGPKTTLPLPAIHIDYTASIIINWIYHIILLVVKSSYHCTTIRQTFCITFQMNKDEMYHAHITNPFWVKS